MEELIRKNILHLTPYQAGKPIEETKRQLGLRKVIKLASNENPLGASPKAVRAIKKNLTSLNRYPDSSGFYLKKKLAKLYGLDSGNFIIGNGSDELIDIIIKTLVEPDETIITADTTFLEYAIIAQTLDRRIVTVPLKYFKYDVEGVKKRIDKKTKLIFIANPNNPTGTYVTKVEMQELINELPDDLVLVLDEAYDTFIDVNDYPQGLHYMRQKNVIVLKTFSKAFGLAGLRIGYAMASQALTGFLERARQPFNVNALAQVAAVAALEDKKFLRKTKEVVLSGKAYMYDNLKKLGLAYVPSVANFILVDVERDGVGVFKEMLKFGVIVRDMKQYGLKNFIRITIGTKKENERCITVLKKVIRNR
ncbi:MAG: histidinol-phosphate transaminase [Candidatus Omnitrophica bacterium]|nr:histidinol-phosphate transaminase [Candidatus Omnitrophota bacterium]